MALKHYSKALADEIASKLKAGEKVVLPGLGVMKPLEKKARIARNPRTGESVSVPAKTVVKFVQSSALDLNAS